MAEQNQQRPPIFLFTDGASSGNPGPGGYGVVLKCAGREMEMSGGFSLTTNNRMELLAVIKGLEAIRWQNAEVHVYSDSSYVVNAVNKGWLENWQRKGYAKVKNPDLWMRFARLYKLHRASESYYLVFGRKCLDYSRTVFRASAGSSYYLSKKREGLFARAEVADKQRGIGKNNADESYLRKIMPLGNHLSAQKNICLRGSEIL